MCFSRDRSATGAERSLVLSWVAVGRWDDETSATQTRTTSPAQDGTSAGGGRNANGAVPTLNTMRSSTNHFRKSDLRSARIRMISS